MTHPAASLDRHSTTDWRQFRLLSNDAMRRLLNAALSSRDIDPMQFALWMVALIGTPPTFYALTQTLGYAALRLAPVAVVERAAMGDRLFFVIYAMLASALLAALTWEALFPDRTDQEIVGVLPVRPATVAAARFGAAATMAVVYAIAINAPAAVLFAFISAIHPAVGPVPGVLLVEVLFFLPAVLASLLGHVLDGGTSTSTIPLVWFAGLYASIAGVGGGTSDANGAIAFAATLAAAAIATLVHLVPATRIGRRALEHRGRERATLLTSLSGRVATRLPRNPGVRSIFMFAVASLARSPRHTMTLPLVFTFFGVFGLRAAMAIPTDIDANWPFRLAHPSLVVATTAAEALLLMFAVVPVAVVELIAAMAIWPATTALVAMSFQLVSGIVLIECALFGWAQVPFARAHAPSSETVKWRWPLYVVALNLYAFRLADLQHLALRSSTGTAIYFVVAIAAAVGLRTARRQRLHRQTLQFEIARGDRLETLNLSEAVN